MAIIDKAMEFSDQQAVTVTAASDGQNDLGPRSWAGNSKGSDTPALPIEITVDVAALAAGAATVSFGLRSAPTQGDLIANTNITTHRTTQAYGKAVLVPGFRATLEIPWDVQRWCDIYYTVATGPLTAGKFSANVVTGRQTNQ